MRKTLSCFLATLLCGLLFWVSPTPAQTLKTGYTSKTIFFLPFFVAQKKGFYQAEDIKVELIQMGTPAVSLQALVAGQIQSQHHPDCSISLVKGQTEGLAGGHGVGLYAVVGSPTKLPTLRNPLGVGSLNADETFFLILAPRRLSAIITWACRRARPRALRVIDRADRLRSSASAIAWP